jgi:monothiol glutaredoxin
MFWAFLTEVRHPAKAGVQGNRLEPGPLDSRLRGNDGKSIPKNPRTRKMDDTVQQRIRQNISETPVVLFMKGSPVFPQCGFSAAVVQILSHIGVKFKGVDVLSDPGIREGIKEFSNWPTIPQLYVKGEFVGGCDIIREMFETGELQQLFEQKGVPVRA